MFSFLYKKADIMMYQCQLYKNYYFLLMIQGSLFSLEHDHKNGTACNYYS